MSIFLRNNETVFVRSRNEYRVTASIFRRFWQWPWFASVLRSCTYMSPYFFGAKNISPLMHHFWALFIVPKPTPTWLIARNQLFPRSSSERTNIYTFGKSNHTTSLFFSMIVFRYVASESLGENSMKIDRSCAKILMDRIQISICMRQGNSTEIEPLSIGYERISPILGKTHNCDEVLGGLQITCL